MSANNYLVFTGIAPHPPIMVPAVGGDAIAEVRSSVDAMSEFTHRVIASGAESVIVISPHAPLEADSFVTYDGPTLQVDFSRFQAPHTQFTVGVDDSLLSAVTRSAAQDGFRMTRIADPVLDHGTAVPLHFLFANGWLGNVVALGYSFLSNEDHLRFGSSIKRAIDERERRVAFIASGDLSHRLRPQAPAGYNPEAQRFDEEVVQSIRTNSPENIPNIDHNLRRLAGECGYRSMLVAIGAARDLVSACEVLSYEAPFGVGYLVAQLTKSDKLFKDELTTLARETVEAFVKSGIAPDAPSQPLGILAEPAPCFVSLKTLDGELRGCIGTIEPTRDTLAEELVSNAISAASVDPRFTPVRAEELPALRYSVDVLLPAESASIDDLDPRVYGVIVEDPASKRRGLLLPDIPGVDEAKQQVEIATRKAGIPLGTPVKLSRFKVERFRE